MAREGKKIEEFKMYLNSHSFPAVLRMGSDWKFVLEVNQLRFEGNTPRDLVHQAQMQLENEHGLDWAPIILVNPDLEDGRLNFRRLFQSASRDGKKVWRLWRFGGDDERQVSTWYRSEEIKTLGLLEGAVPGDRADGPKLVERELPYTPGRWQSIVKLDQMLAEATKTVAEKLSEVIRQGDFDGFLGRAVMQGVPRIVFDGAANEKEQRS